MAMLALYMAASPYLMSRTRWRARAMFHSVSVATLLTYRQSMVRLLGLSIRMEKTLDRNAGMADTEYTDCASSGNFFLGFSDFAPRRGQIFEEFVANDKQLTADSWLSKLPVKTACQIKSVKAFSTEHTSKESIGTISTSTNRRISASSAHLCTKDCDKKESPLKKLLDDSASFQDVPVSKQQWVTLPYPEGTKIERPEIDRKPKVDPRDTSIILFPGQGTQYVGMAKGLLKFPIVKDLFELANYILKYDLLKLCLEGPKKKLDETKYCQPAVLVTSLAAIERLKEERPNAIENCVATAGFSLGELTALIFSGAIEFERVIYGPDSKLKYACLKAKEWALDKGDPLPECKIASYLSPNSKVVAGSESALDFLEKNYKEFHIRRVMRLPVSGAFHSEIMRPAMETFKRALAKTEISEPAVTVYSNVDGKRYRNADHIRRQLPKQIMSSVKWEQFLHYVYSRDPSEHFPRTFEVGPGTSLKAMLKQLVLYLIAGGVC
ncbi:unnamed protein product [Callosobruchus maculatus]|uniref:[acyl-carrier-protein] S-malonyltransferase n=1 Tax=Callosobruchus maculatus TaxID=64391 RepID=A0A653CYV2_CALMS|nr:unnamed protein product [Callosobruchus maculatus]